MNEELIFLLGMLFSVLIDLLVEPIRRKWRKQCNFKCDNCKVFDCSVWDCKRQQKNINNKKGGMI